MVRDDRLRVVLDANVVLRGMRAACEGREHGLTEGWRRGDYELVVTDHLLEETLTTALTDRSLKIDPETAVRITQEIRDKANLIPAPRAESHVVRDAKDDYLVDAARERPADRLVSDDRDILDAKKEIATEAPHTRVQTPRQFALEMQYTLQHPDAASAYRTGQEIAERAGRPDVANARASAFSEPWREELREREREYQAQPSKGVTEAQREELHRREREREVESEQLRRQQAERQARGIRPS